MSHWLEVNDGRVCPESTVSLLSCQNNINWFFVCVNATFVLISTRKSPTFNLINFLGPAVFNQKLPRLRCVFKVLLLSVVNTKIELKKV